MTTAVKQETEMAEYKSESRSTLPSSYGCEILVEDGTWEQVTTKDAPNDARIVKYVVDEKVCYDLTRGPKVSKIFDMYWDRYREGIKSINFGYGRVNPKLWGEKPKEKKKRK
jgi:hypothetical protein